MFLKKTIWSVACVLLTFSMKAQESATSPLSAEPLLFDVASLETTNQIEIYPNPSIEFIIVEIKNSEMQRTEFEMHSIIGNEIDFYTEEIGQDKYKINVKGFSAGYYFLVIKDDVSQFKEAYKFLKK